MVKKLKTDFILPGANAVVLTTELADQLVDHMIADKQNRFSSYVLAAGIRKAHRDKKTDIYSDEFHHWYDENELDQVFGDAPNFSKFASAGDVVAHVSKMDDAERYMKQLPVSKGALYACSFILQPRKKPRAKYELEFKRCLMMHPTRKSVDEPQHEWGNKGKTPVIHPRATELEIRQWLRNWENPPPPKPKRDKLKRDQPLATIMFSGSLYDFLSVRDRKVSIEASIIETYNVISVAAETSEFVLVNDAKNVKQCYYFPR